MSSRSAAVKRIFQHSDGYFNIKLAAQSVIQFFKLAG
jgi:hypothetical protein